LGNGDEELSCREKPAQIHVKATTWFAKKGLKYGAEDAKKMASS